MKNLHLIVILILCILPNIVFADFDVTEVMYDPEGADTGREWIEILNSGDTDLIIVGGTKGGSWRLLEESPGKKSASKTFGFVGEGTSSITIPSDSYAVIAKDAAVFSNEFPEFDGLLLTSTATLTNAEGKQLTLINGAGEKMSEPVLYTPQEEASGTGASLQLQPDGEWIPALPTPGEVNSHNLFVITADSKEEEIGDDFLDIESDWPFSGEKVYVDAGGNKRVFAKEEVIFSGEARFKNGDDVNKASFRWAFGDGEGDTGKEAEHTYRHPGVYRVLLQVAYAGKMHTDTFLVQVLDPSDITLLKSDNHEIDIVNGTGVEAELSGWTLKTDKDSKELAEGTIILTDAPTPIPFEIGLSPNVRLYSSNGTLVSTISLSPQGALARNEKYEEMLKQLYEMLREAEENSS